MSKGEQNFRFFPSRGPSDSTYMPPHSNLVYAFINVEFLLLFLAGYDVTLDGRPLMLLPCLESQGCHFIPLSCLDSPLIFLPSPLALSVSSFLFVEELTHKGVN